MEILNRRRPTGNISFKMTWDGYRIGAYSCGMILAIFFIMLKQVK